MIQDLEKNLEISTCMIIADYLSLHHSRTNFQVSLMAPPLNGFIFFCWGGDMIVLYLYLYKFLMNDSQTACSNEAGRIQTVTQALNNSRLDRLKSLLKMEVLKFLSDCKVRLRPHNQSLNARSNQTCHGFMHGWRGKTHTHTHSFLKLLQRC